MESEISVRLWRMTRGIPGGCHIWFDPAVESVRLFRVPTSEQRSLSERLHYEGVDSRDSGNQVDNMVSVRELEGEGESSVNREVNGAPGEDQELLPF